MSWKHGYTPRCPHCQKNISGKDLCSLWLHRLPDHSQAHDFYSKRRLLVRMWNEGRGCKETQLFDREVFIRIRAYAVSLWNSKWRFPEQPKYFWGEMFGHLSRTISCVCSSSKKAPSSISRIPCSKTWSTSPHQARGVLFCHTTCMYFSLLSSNINDWMFEHYGAFRIALSYCYVVNQAT